MAGGVGSRFWPMSTEDYPKQFIDVLGVGRSLLQLTFDRFSGICAPEHIWILTNQKYADIVRRQLPEVPAENVLCEPCRRNTAPCIAYASWRIKASDSHANIVVAPSDHIVMDVPEFKRVITQCLAFCSESDAMLTLGMKPTRPETGYGYIQADLGSSSVRNKEIFRVDSFREKPDLETAQQYIQNRIISGMPVSLSGTCGQSSMPIACISRHWQNFSKISPASMELRRNKPSWTAVIPNARISASITPSWKRQKRCSFVRQTSAGAI